MQHGALGVENEIRPRCVLFDLTGPVLTLPWMLAATDVCSSPLAALHGEARTRPLRTSGLSVVQVRFHSEHRGGSRENL